MEIQIYLADELLTRALGHLIAEFLPMPALIALSGDLGVGKTCLTQAMIEKFGILEPITSPTFTLVNHYEPPSIFHLDLYRLQTFDDLLELGFEEFLTEGVVIVEWANRFEQLFKYEPLSIELNHHPPGRQARIIYPPRYAILEASLIEFKKRYERRA